MWRRRQCGASDETDEADANADSEHTDNKPSIYDAFAIHAGDNSIIGEWTVLCAPCGMVEGTAVQSCWTFEFELCGSFTPQGGLPIAAEKNNMWLR